MQTTHKIPYRNGELRIGWASWDDGSHVERSIKYAYRDSSGKISRGSPELPFDVLVDMFFLAAEQGELPKPEPKEEVGEPRDLSQASLEELKAEKKDLSAALALLLRLVVEIRWANWRPIYDQLGARLEAVKDELFKRSHLWGKRFSHANNL